MTTHSMVVVTFAEHQKQYQHCGGTRGKVNSFMYEFILETIRASIKYLQRRHLLGVRALAQTSKLNSCR